MAKKTRRAAAADASAGENPRRPCPCGSGKRYKACHGAGDDVIVTRPFAGLAAECELVAMREFLPSATAPLPTRDGQVATIATVLPGASAALVRPNGEVLLGMQVQTRSGDLSADVARALRWARDAEPGSALPVVPPTGGDAVRLQDLLDVDAPLDLTIHGDFTWWLAPEDAASPSAEVTATLERANAVIMPTEAVVADGVRAAYWVDTGSKAHVRWVRAEPEERLVVALARLQAAGGLGLGEGARYVGSFRAHGLVVPVWDLPADVPAEDWIEPATQFDARLQEALTVTEPLTADERRARAGLLSRQITIR